MPKRNYVNIGWRTDLFVKAANPFNAFYGIMTRLFDPKVTRPETDHDEPCGLYADYLIKLPTYIAHLIRHEMTPKTVTQYIFDHVEKKKIPLYIAGLCSSIKRWRVKTFMSLIVKSDEK